MSQNDTFELPKEQERVLVKDLAEAVLGQAAPEELVLFDETAQEYFDDPDQVLHARSRDEPVGFGLELALLTPYVLAVVGPVVTFLVSLVANSAKEGSKTLVAEWVRSLFKPKDKTSTAVVGSLPALTPEQARRVRDVAYERAAFLGLPATTATLLADSVVGGLIVAG
jgi:hypothetical protein